MLIISTVIEYFYVQTPAILEARSLKEFSTLLQVALTKELLNDFIKEQNKCGASECFPPILKIYMLGLVKW